MASKYFLLSSWSFLVSDSSSWKRRSASMKTSSLVCSPMLNLDLSCCGAYPLMSGQTRLTPRGQDEKAFPGLS